MDTRKELLTIVGSTVYASVFRQRAEYLLENLHRGAGNQMRQSLASAGEDEVSEEIVVWGDRDEGGSGGGTDVLTLDPWMWEFEIAIIDRFGPLPDPGNTPTGDDTPTPTPCELLAQQIASMKSVIAAEETAIKAIEELLAEADSPAERKALQQQKRNALKNIRETRDLISKMKDEMKQLDC